MGPHEVGYSCVAGQGREARLRPAALQRYPRSSFLVQSICHWLENIMSATVMRGQALRYLRFLEVGTSFLVIGLVALLVLSDAPVGSSSTTSPSCEALGGGAFSFVF